MHKTQNAFLKFWVFSWEISVSLKFYKIKIKFKNKKYLKLQNKNLKNLLENKNYEK